LYWPKSKCFDYLYQDAEVLLSNYPVQATICLYQEGGSGDSLRLSQRPAAEQPAAAFVNISFELDPEPPLVAPDTTRGPAPDTTRVPAPLSS
jgi:hypothetical protein